MKIETIKVIREGNSAEFVVINKEDMRPSDKVFKPAVGAKEKQKDVTRQVPSKRKRSVSSPSG